MKLNTRLFAVLAFILLIVSVSSSPLMSGIADLDALIRKYDSERDLKSFERFATLQEIAEEGSRDSSEFLGKVIRDPKEEVSLIEAAIRMISLHDNGIGLKAVVEKGLVQLPEKSHWVIRECWDRDLNDEEVDYLVDTGLGLVSRLPMASQGIVLSIGRKVEDPEIGKVLLKLLGNRKIPAKHQVYIVELVRRNRVEGATKKLGKMFRIDDPDLQKEILLALRDLEASDQSKTFHRALKSPHWPVRAVAADIFGATRDQEIVKTLIPLLD
ncbi:MAG: hypothetical protein GWP35_05235, partial [Proteobacteria bacterium]|nr:hypothetical protein [Pseudomonadota bacterium]